MNRLSEYLAENLILDFQGELDLNQLRSLLADDDDPSARALLAKVVDDRAVNDLLIVVADCLLDVAQQVVTREVIAAQLRRYSEH